MFGLKKNAIVVWMLILSDYGKTDNWDVYGIYSSYELADTAKQAIKRDDGKYEGVRPDLIYDCAIIDHRIVDHNLPI